MTKDRRQAPAVAGLNGVACDPAGIDDPGDTSFPFRTQVADTDDKVMPTLRSTTPSGPAVAASTISTNRFDSSSTTES